MAPPLPPDLASGGWRGGVGGSTGEPGPRALGVLPPWPSSWHRRVSIRASAPPSGPPFSVWRGPLSDAAAAARDLAFSTANSSTPIPNTLRQERMGRRGPREVAGDEASPRAEATRPRPEASFLP
uniref:Uncharacterized protein n=1 Tax=Arundo donax TaxID=35708 RepID=A0A0A9ALQ1_ARUDO